MRVFCSWRSCSGMLKPAPKSAFLFLFAISSVVAWRSLLGAFSLAAHDEEYTHLLLILPIVAALIFLDWRSVDSMSAPGPRSGILLLSIALLIAGFAWWPGTLAADERLSANMLALVTWWIGSFVLCFGTRVARGLLFPLCFLFLVVPLPRFMVNTIIGWLQHGSALVAHGMFSAVGVPVSQDGVLLTIPGLTVEVATECSSIRSSSMLLVVTMLLAQLFLRTAWRKWLLIVVAIPVSVFKNALRIFTIAMLGTRVDPGYLNGRLHHEGGVLFFAVGLGSIFCVLWLLHRSEQKPLS